MNLTMEERVARFETMRREGRLLRGAWVDTDAEGRERACWLAALSPEVSVSGDAGECPADVMPLWLARLAPGLDDAVSAAAWPAMAKRFGRCAAQWRVLDAEAWARVERDVKLEALSVARASVTVDRWGVLPVIDEVMRLLRDGGSREEWVKVQDMVTVVAYATAVDDAAYAAAYAAGYAATGAAYAAAAADAVYAGARAAAHAAGLGVVDAAATWDQVATALFDAIDREVLNAQAEPAQELP